MFSLMDSTISVGALKNQYHSFNEYLEVSSDPFLIHFWDDNTKTLNVKALVNHYENGLTKLNNDTFMLFGNFYTAQNRGIIMERLETIFKDRPDSSGLIWLANSESKTWGKTADLNKLVDEVYNLFDKRKKTSKIILGMACESYQESMNLKNNFWKLSNAELMDLPAKFGGADAEFMIIPGLMVASLFHLQQDEQRDLSLPVGYISFDPKFVSKVSIKFFDWMTLQPKYNDFFEKKDIKEDQKVRNKCLAPILHQIKPAS